MKLPNFTDNFISGIHGLQMPKSPGPKWSIGCFPAWTSPLCKAGHYVFESCSVSRFCFWQQWLSKLGGFFSSLYFFLNPCDLFLALIFFIGLLSPKSWTPASMLCSCLYCCIPSQGMGVEDAVFSVVGKWRPAILESFHGYTSSGFYSKLAKHPEGMTRRNVVWEWDCGVWCFACVSKIKLFRWPCLWLYLASPCLTANSAAFSWHGFFIVCWFKFFFFFKRCINLWGREAN